MKLTWSQWLRLGIGGLAWTNKHRDAVDDAVALWQSVVPTEAPESGMTHTEALEKVRTGNMTEAEQRVMERASQTFGGQ